ncbi:MAG: MaoC family dehydratase [Anaerolineales bacterium]
MAGKFYEELAVGQVIQHRGRRTITEMDNVLFCSLTMNPQPLHLDETFAAQTDFGARIVNGIFTLGLVVGLSVPDLTEGTIVANLGYEQIRHPHPLYHGDTVHVHSEIIAKRPANSRPECGVVNLRHLAFNQHDTLVCDVQRAVLFLRQDAPAQ